jgi:hypothetical protein
MTIDRRTMTSMAHVDVVKNEWLAGYQVVVAQVSAGVEGLLINSPNPEFWSEVVMRPIVVAETGDEVHAEKDPQRFLALLPRGIHGTYLFATEPHSERECPYAGYPLRPIQSESASFGSS